MKIIIDSDKLMERKVLRKVVYGRKEGVKREKTRRKEGKKNRGVKTFHSLGITSLVHARTTEASVCGHIPHQAQSLSCHFQKGGRGGGMIDIIEERSCPL